MALIDKDMLIRDIKTLLDVELDDTSKDGKLSILFNNAVNFITLYCNNPLFAEGLPSTFSGIVMDLMMVRLNRLGAEGMESEKIGDLWATYSSSELSDTNKKLLYRFRVMGVR